MQIINGFHLNPTYIKTCECPIFFLNISCNIQKIAEIIFRPGGHMVVQEKQKERWRNPVGFAMRARLETMGT